MDWGEVIGGGLGVGGRSVGRSGCKSGLFLGRTSSGSYRSLSVFIASCMLEGSYSRVDGWLMLHQLAIDVGSMARAAGRGDG